MNFSGKPKLTDDLSAFMALQEVIWKTEKCFLLKNILGIKAVYQVWIKINSIHVVLWFFITEYLHPENILAKYSQKLHLLCSIVSFSPQGLGSESCMEEEEISSIPFLKLGSCEPAMQVKVSDLLLSSIFQPSTPSSV